MNGVYDADRQLAAVIEAVRSIDRDQLPDEIAEDVERATFTLLKAKGNCEVTRSGGSAE